MRFNINSPEWLQRGIKGVGSSEALEGISAAQILKALTQKNHRDLHLIV